MKKLVILRQEGVVKGMIRRNVLSQNDNFLKTEFAKVIATKTHIDNIHAPSAVLRVLLFTYCILIKKLKIRQIFKITKEHSTFISKDRYWIGFYQTKNNNKEFIE